MSPCGHVAERALHLVQRLPPKPSVGPLLEKLSALRFDELLEGVPTRTVASAVFELFVGSDQFVPFQGAAVEPLLYWFFCFAHHASLSGGLRARMAAHRDLRISRQPSQAGLA